MENLHKFYFDAIVVARKTGWRYGQAMFNHLMDIRPELAESVRATDMDPFYCSSPNDPRFDKFVVFIETHWYDAPKLTLEEREFLKEEVDHHYQ